MQLELKRIQREVGIAFVLVTHDQGEALTMSDRIAVMREGRVEQVGTPEEIYQRPASLFVAGFIGSANLLPGSAEERDGEDAVVQLGCGPRLRVSGGAAGVAAGKRVTVMLRPERLRPVAEAPVDGRGLATTVIGLVFQGASTRLELALEDGTRLVTHVPSHTTLPFVERGRKLWVTWEPGSAHLLPGWPYRAGATSLDALEVEAAL
jgi:spermidine/putrescine transport system ATP-binding protein